MVNCYKIVGLAFLMISSVASMSFFSISQQISGQDPVVMTGMLEQNDLLSTQDPSMFSKIFENDSSISNFLNGTNKDLLKTVGGSLFKVSDPPKPDPEVRKAHIKYAIRSVKRGIKNVKDILKFLGKQEAGKYVSLPNHCDDLSAPCPYFELLKKQLGRVVENINDEIAFIEEELKKKDCKYLRLRLSLLQKDLQIVQAIIKFIEDHNKLSDGKKDFIELLKLIFNLTHEKLKEIKEFLKGLLSDKVTAIKSFDKQPNDDKDCPFLKLQEKIQWRKAVDEADKFGFVYWVRHRHSHSRRDCRQLKRKIRRAIRRIIRFYRGRHHNKNRRHHSQKRINNSKSFILSRPMGFSGFGGILRNLHKRLMLGRKFTAAFVNKDSGFTETA